MKGLIDIISKYQKCFLGLAIFLCLCAVSINYTDGEISLTLENYPLIMMLLVALGIIAGLIYVSIDKSKIASLSNQIVDLSLDKISSKTLLKELTTRQTEVYNLIMEGKSNKEIMSIMFIEQSTLKSHINQIYKKLKVSSRKELKSN